MNKTEAIVGTDLIVPQMALLEDVVAHAVLPGLAIATFLNMPLLTVAFVFGMFGISQDLLRNGDRFNLKVLKKQ